MNFNPLLLIFFIKQIGVSAGVEHYKDKFGIVLLPNQQPIRLDMTFPLPLTVAVKLMLSIFFFKNLTIKKFTNNRP